MRWSPSATCQMRTRSGLESLLVNRASPLRIWWPGTELNRRRQPFQGCALPPELPGQVRNPLMHGGLRGCSLHADCSGIANGMKLLLPNACGTFLIIAMAATLLNVGDAPDRGFAAPRELLCRNREVSQPRLAHSQRMVASPNLNAYWPPADELCCPSHDASCGSCCDFRSTQLLICSMDWR